MCDIQKLVKHNSTKARKTKNKKNKYKKISHIAGTLCRLKTNQILEKRTGGPGSCHYLPFPASSPKLDKQIFSFLFCDYQIQRLTKTLRNLYSIIFQRKNKFFLCWYCFLQGVTSKFGNISELSLTLRQQQSIKKSIKRVKQLFNKMVVKKCFLLMSKTKAPRNKKMLKL